MNVLGALILSLVLISSSARGDDETFARDNIVHLVKSFPVTALVEIEDYSPVREIRDDKGRVGYIEFKVRARVVELFKGRLPRKLEFFVTQEQPSNPPGSGTYIVTLFQAKDGRLIFADDSVWWVKSTPALASAARSAGTGK